MKQDWLSAGDIAYVLYPLVPLRWLVALARWQGRLETLRRGRVAAAVRDNFSREFGDERGPSEIKQMTRRYCEYERIRALLIMLAPRMSLEEMSAMLPFEGLANLDRALERQNGVILLGSHINSVVMFIAIIMLRLRGYPVGVALPEPGDAWGRTRFRKWHDRRGEGRYTVGEGIGGFYCRFNIRPIIRRLKRNEIVAQTGDGWHSTKFVEVEFLGRKVPFTTGSMAIAQLTGASVVPLFQIGTPPDGLRLVVEESFVIDKDSPEDLQAKVAVFASRLEDRLRRNIECWQHWRIPNTIETMATWPQRSLGERLSVAQEHH